MADKVKKVVTSELLNAYVAGQIKPYIDKGDSSASSDVAEERARAEAAESSLENALASEASKREFGDETLQSGLDEEIARAKTTEQSVANQINDVVNEYDEHFESLDSSVSSLTTSLDTLSKKERADVQTLSGEITAINDKIPSQASSENQLADKDFVNSSISTATAVFRGTVQSLGALKALTGDLNDYAYVETTDETTGLILKYDRYKYSEVVSEETGNWAFEYTLNNSSFTSDQWKAITSGITSELVAQITTNKDAITQETTRAQAKETELEDAISKAGKIDDVKIDGTSVVTDKVANIDLTDYVTLDTDQTITGEKTIANDFNTQSILPISAGTYSLGSDKLYYKDLYLSGSISDKASSITVAEIVAKQDALTAGDNITISDDNVISSDLSKYAKCSELAAEETSREAGDTQTLTEAKSYVSSCIGSAVNSLLGVSGTLTIKASDWSSGKCTATIDGLNDTDALIVSGSTSEDQKKIGAANLFASASSSTVTFTAETAPTEAISLNYFIARGK